MSWLCTRGQHWACPGCTTRLRCETHKCPVIPTNNLWADTAGVRAVCEFGCVEHVQNTCRRETEGPIFQPGGIHAGGLTELEDAHAAAPDVAASGGAAVRVHAGGATVLRAHFTRCVVLRVVLGIPLHSQQFEAIVVVPAGKKIGSVVATVWGDAPPSIHCGPVKVHEATHIWRECVPTPPRCQAARQWRYLTGTAPHAPPALRGIWAPPPPAFGLLPPTIQPPPPAYTQTELGFRCCWCGVSHDTADAYLASCATEFQGLW